MSDVKTSHAQQTPPPPGKDGAEARLPFSGIFDDQLRRWEAMQKEYASLEQKSVDQAQLFIDETAKIMKAAIDHSMKLTNEWRRLAIEGARQATGTKS